MNFAFSEEQEELRRYARQWLADRSPSKIVRDLMATDVGFDRSQWAEIAQMGWQGMAIPEEYGGAGFGFLELAVLIEEQGSALFPSPFFSTVVMAADALVSHGSDEQKKEWLPKIAAGELVATLAITEPNGRWDEQGIEATAEQSESGWTINGTKSFVLDGHAADLLIVAARTAGEVSLFLVPANVAGVGRTSLDTMDPTRKQARIEFDSVSVPVDAILGVEGSGWDITADVYRTAIVALAVEQVGGAQRCLDMAVEYAKDRQQFGRPIGSFQAIKHKCADMLVQVESARSAAYYAGWAAAEDPDELAVAAPTAKSYCSDAYFFCAAENIQVHGGIGFTWEHDAHLYFKRAKTSQLMLGDGAEWRAKLAGRIGI